MKLSYRLSVRRFDKEEDFAALLAFLGKYPGCVDELSLFTEFWHHGYYPLEQFADFCGVLGDRFQRLKGAGIKSVGINMLCTIGHIDEAWDILPGLPCQPMVGYDGAVSRSCFCPGSEEFKDYVREKYKLIAAINPDFIWVDDDVRVAHHENVHNPSIDYGCFCPCCIAAFNRQGDTDYTREQLVEKLHAPDGGQQRKQWVLRNIEVIDELCKIIRDTVHSMHPEIELGLMLTSVELLAFGGGAWNRWLRSLGAVRARPGGGFYSDATPGELIYKALDIDRQKCFLPPDIRDIQYEVENFPYQKLKKSLHILMVECAASVACGMNGIAYNAIKDLPGTFEDTCHIMDAIQKNRPLWDAMDEIAGDYPSAGFHPVYKPSIVYESPVTVGNWFDYNNPDITVSKTHILSELGVPITPRGDTACGFILTGNMPYACSKEELTEILSHGVLMDGKALEAVWEMGVGELCGVKAWDTYDNGMVEKFTGDILNGPYQGESRDCRLSFWKQYCYTLEPVHQNVRVLSELVSYSGQRMGPAFTLYENNLGGRIAVHGYAPWDYLHSTAKRYQVLETLSWLSRNTMPVKISKSIKVIAFMRVSRDKKRFMLMLLNASFDATGAFEAEIADPAGTMCRLQQDGQKEPLAFSGDGRKCVVPFDNIPPWEFAVLCAE